MKILIQLLAMIGLAAVANADAVPGINVQGVTANGSGCPQGSYSVALAPDGSVFTVLMDNYIAQATRQMTLDRKLCELKVVFNVPAGWRFSLISADYRGSAIVSAGAVATHQALYSFDGSQPINERSGYENTGKNSFRTQNITGPFDDDYLVHNDIDPSVAPWSPCNLNAQQTLYITTFLTARSLDWRNPADAMITLDSVDGGASSQQYRMQWQRCAGPVRPTPQPLPPGPIRPTPRPGPFPGPAPGPIRPGPVVRR